MLSRGTPVCVVFVERVRGLLPHKVLPLALELCRGGFYVHLLSMQAVRLLLKVGRVAVGTLVQQHEPRCLLRLSLNINVVAHARWGVVVDVIRIVLRSVPRLSLNINVEGTK